MFSSQLSGSLSSSLVPFQTEKGGHQSNLSDKTFHGAQKVIFLFDTENTNVMGYFKTTPHFIMFSEV